MGAEIGMGFKDWICTWGFKGVSHGRMGVGCDQSRMTGCACNWLCRGLWGLGKSEVTWWRLKKQNGEQRHADPRNLSHEVTARDQDKLCVHDMRPLFGQNVNRLLPGPYVLRGCLDPVAALD